MSDLIRVERDGALLYVTFNRPDKHNAFNHAMIRSITATLREAAHDAGVRVCILRGSGRSFTSGADLVEVLGQDPFGIRDANRLWIEMFEVIETIPQPVIASVHGYAIAGGTELSLCCDFVVASEDAVLGLTEIGIGVVPGGGACVRLTRWVGRAAAKELLMLGSRISASDAQRIGLVHRVVPRAELEEATRSLALRLAEQSPLALAAAKRAINIGSEMELRHGIEYVLQEFALLFAGEDYREGITAFLEKRQAVFQGQRSTRSGAGEGKI